MEQDTKHQTQNSNTGETGSQSSTSGEKMGQSLVEELNRLGNKFAEAVQVAWESDERKKLEQDLKRGLSSLSTNLEDGLRKVSESQQTKEFLDKAEDVASTVADRVQKSKMAQELGDSLLKGLRSLTEQIDKLADELQSKNTPPTPGASAQTSQDKPQDIPIDKA